MLYLWPHLENNSRKRNKIKWSALQTLTRMGITCLSLQECSPIIAADAFETICYSNLWTIIISCNLCFWICMCIELCDCSFICGWCLPLFISVAGILFCLGFMKVGNDNMPHLQTSAYHIDRHSLIILDDAEQGAQKKISNESHCGENLQKKTSYKCRSSCSRQNIYYSDLELVRLGTQS